MLVTALMKWYVAAWRASVTIGHVQRRLSQQNDGSAALHFAAGRGHTGTVSKLLQHSANVNLKRVRASCCCHHNVHHECTRGVQKDGWTPLLLAAAAGHVDTVDALVAAGASVADRTVRNGCAALLRWADLLSCLGRSLGGRR